MVVPGEPTGGVMLGGTPAGGAESPACLACASCACNLATSAAASASRCSSSATFSLLRPPCVASCVIPRPPCAASCVEGEYGPGSEVLPVGHAEPLETARADQGLHLHREEGVAGLGVDAVVDGEVPGRAHRTDELDRHLAAQPRRRR